MRHLFIVLSILCSQHLWSYSVQTLTLEEKIGQLLMVQFYGTFANDDARALIQDVQVGGIIYYNFSNSLHSPDQVYTLSRGLQHLAAQNTLRIPLLIAADQEGGRVARLQGDFPVFPGNGTVGKMNDPELAKQHAYAMGRELRSVGIGMNLAPVVDINSNPSNPIINDRAFGGSAQIVAAFGKKALEGYREACVLSTLKHFPGHGDTETDSHLELPVITKTLQEMEQMELIPFAALAGDADAIMTAHILVPALDPQYCATLSEKTISYLRNAIGFKGAVITDSLVMQGVLQQCGSVDEAAIQALHAGCDILLLGGKRLTEEISSYELTVADIKRIHASLVHAVESGRIQLQRVDEAVERIFNLKKHYTIP